MGTLLLFRGKVTDDGRLALYILAGTIPAILFGYALKKLNVPDLERNITVVAWNTVIYGVLMLVADMYGRQEKTINDVTLEKRLYHRMRAGACPHSRNEPFRRHHDGRTLPEFHRAPMRLAFRFFSASRPPAAAIVLTLGDALQSGCHITYGRAAGAGVHLRRRYSARSPS